MRASAVIFAALLLVTTLAVPATSDPSPPDHSAGSMGVALALVTKDPLKGWTLSADAPVLESVASAHGFRLHIPTAPVGQDLDTDGNVEDTIKVLINHVEAKTVLVNVTPEEGNGVSIPPFRFPPADYAGASFTLQFLDSNGVAAVTSAADIVVPTFSVQPCSTSTNFHFPDDEWWHRAHNSRPPSEVHRTLPLRDGGHQYAMEWNTPTGTREKSIIWSSQTDGPLHFNALANPSMFHGAEAHGFEDTEVVSYPYGSQYVGGRVWVMDPQVVFEDNPYVTQIQMSGSEVSQEGGPSHHAVIKKILNGLATLTPSMITIPAYMIWLVHAMDQMEEEDTQVAQPKSGIAGHGLEFGNFFTDDRQRREGAWSIMANSWTGTTVDFTLTLESAHEIDYFARSQVGCAFAAGTRNAWQLTYITATLVP